MPRSGRRIYHLARSRGVDSHEVLRRLQAAGFNYHSERDLVSRSELSRVDSLIGPLILTTDQLADVTTPPVFDVSSPPNVGRDLPPNAPETRPARRGGLETIGRSVPEMRYLLFDAVLNIHFQLVDDFAKTSDPIEPAGVRDDGGFLHSALSRPMTSLGEVGKYPTIEMAGAALLHSLVHNHPFHNGNKRTAVVSLVAFLDLNGLVLTADDDELLSFITMLAGHTLPAVEPGPDSETTAIARWIALHSRRLSNVQLRLRFRELTSILRRYDCEIERRNGNRVMVRRGSLKAHFGARNEGDEIDPGTVNHLRRLLELDDDHGVDADTFFFNADRIPPFIQKYRKVLDQLADR